MRMAVPLADGGGGADGGVEWLKKSFKTPSKMHSICDSFEHTATCTLKCVRLSAAITDACLFYARSIFFLRCTATYPHIRILFCLVLCFFKWYFYCVFLFINSVSPKLSLFFFGVFSFSSHFIPFRFVVNSFCYFVVCRVSHLNLFLSKLRTKIRSHIRIERERKKTC